mmetsp:Transcript_1098/g.1152  ORF Transcript_1098/g.1152 Transcript_1098/m.1152 type:complete len:421 (-) Transcript_1098:176-1438(-)
MWRIRGALSVSKCQPLFKMTVASHTRIRFRMMSDKNEPSLIPLNEFIEDDGKQIDPLTAFVPKRVLILYTGGTMGMKYDKHGSLAVEPGYLTECLKAFPELNTTEMPVCDIVEFLPLMDSSMMGPKDWVKIADHISESYLLYDGFVVITGTDTMSYASSALSFMLENLGKPVIFTGSQIPFGEVYNDARRNIIVSTVFATTTDLPEVCLFYNDKLIRGNRAARVDSINLSAFDSPNYPPLATVDTQINLNTDLTLAIPRADLKIHTLSDVKIAVLKLIPGMHEDIIRALVNNSKGLKAIVLEITGSGYIPSRKEQLIKVIKEAKQNGILVVAISQCLKGGVTLDAYSMGREFQENGVISGGDLTAEACTTKLAYLLGRVKHIGAVGKLLTTDLRGEVSSPKEKGRKYFDDTRDSMYLSRY